MDRLKILVVGNLPPAGGILSARLKNEGFDVTVADSPTDYTGTLRVVDEELSRKKYDMFMPTNLALSPKIIQAFIPQIKNKYLGLRIIVLSGHKTQEFRRSLEEEGVDEFVPIPLDWNVLVRKVRSAFDEENRLRKAQRKLSRATGLYRHLFEAKVIGYDGKNYKVGFIKKPQKHTSVHIHDWWMQFGFKKLPIFFPQEGSFIQIELIPRKEIDRLVMFMRPSHQLEELLGWIGQVAKGEGVC